MADYQISTLDGGVSQIEIVDSIEKSDRDLFQALSHMSKKCNQLIVNLLGLTGGESDFFGQLFDISARTNLKVVVNNPDFISKCHSVGLATFPTLKSAALSCIGDETIRTLLAKLRDVPILNTEAYKLIEYINSPDADFPHLEKMIQGNAGLCSQIFRMANSSYFMRTSRAETVRQALVTLGMVSLRQLFLYNFYGSVGKFFGCQKATAEHGRKCAFLAEFISKAGGGNGTEYAKVRLAGLLHDVGRQAMAFVFPQQYDRVDECIKNENKPSYLAELLIFGTEHQTIGSILACRWNFPDYLSKVIGDHHYLHLPDWYVLTLPVFCANNFLDEMDKNPFFPYLPRLEEYFALKGLEMPWKDVKKEFTEFLQTYEDPFP